MTPSMSVANTNDKETLVLKFATNIYTAYICIYIYINKTNKVLDSALSITLAHIFQTIYMGSRRK